MYTQVQRWPEWTASVSEVRFLEGDSVVVGTRVRILQPKLAPAAWEVTAVDPGRSWTWVSKAPGVTTSGLHALEPTGDGSTRVQLAIVQRGVLAPLVGARYGGIIRRYLDVEAAGLKRRCETDATP